ncbi:MAG: DNA primase [Candidatus Shapirobacteria bacterium]|nr:DNA primase [Candidatus Shapirobacteria bacterium]MDD3003020.1 DNA primase [Candidatus Shapirobacteria bacterium]MDD4383393.1 DNA primase [Candidatus Shapirobacteria bacterium]
MDNQVEEIKQKVNIIDVINRYVPLKKRGRHHFACCPFHGEKTPSFTVSEELQIFKCFGCGKAGDVFTFLQEYERIDFREALEELAKLSGVTLIKSSLIDHQESKKKLLIEINSQVAKFYNYILLSHSLGKDALEYVTNRGITLETIKTFNIGFSPEDSKYLSNFILKKGYKIDDLIDTGTFGNSRFNSGLYDRFNGRLTFPLLDYRGHIVGFSGRILPTSKNPNLAKYINSPETEIYHKSQMLFGLNLAKEAIRQENSVIVVEGEFDMISPFQSGFKNIVALKGTAFTQDQLQLLRRYTDTLILALDSDFAGNNAARKSIELADSMEFDIKVLNLGDKYKDPDEAIKSDLEFFKFQFKKATDVWDFIIQSQLKIHDINTIKGKKEVLSVVLPLLIKIKNSVVKSDYFKKLANEINSSEESIYEEAKKYQNSNPTNFKLIPKGVEIIETSESKTEKLEELLLTLIIGAKDPVKLSQKLKKYLDQLTVSRFKTIAKYLLEKEDLTLRQILDSLPAEIKPLFENLYFESQKNQIDSVARLSEIKKATNNINKILLKDRLNQLSNQITKFESEENEEALKEVETEYNQTLEKLHQLQTNKI